ncbi:hypothetical protein AXF42_Ash004205 [Apostasia shenzhenica]|uniref:DUF506 family protein n=1 Tax=Apostasia shenzhenica TaxID=1088818 RepID=A0A2I0A2A9_9ASPA|nr:hypothetical protein AXF42_Ash004205 [Apostasia shenzhenica]
MAVYIRAKRVTDPLDERVRARLRGEMTGYSSSGSEHEGAAGAAADEPSCFSDLVHEFLETGDEEGDRGGEDSESDGGAGDGSSIDRAEEQAQKLRELLKTEEEEDSFRRRLCSEVELASAALAELRPVGPVFRRAVMVRLRERGYNAGICKARWESAGGLTAGSYEYVDVVLPPSAGEGGEKRYIVDLAFAAEFELARATDGYRRVAEELPDVVAAEPEELQAAVRIMSEAARRSLKSMELSVPPWRKKRYMMAKWLGPYRRTTNHLPAKAGAAAIATGGGGRGVIMAIGFLVPRVGGEPEGGGGGFE